jgi:hypothetical protein
VPQRPSLVRNGATLLDPTRPNGARMGIGFELHPRQDRSRPSLGTIVAVEGGPGYATTGSRPTTSTCSSR